MSLSGLAGAPKSYFGLRASTSILGVGLILGLIVSLDLLSRGSPMSFAPGSPLWIAFSAGALVGPRLWVAWLARLHARATPGGSCERRRLEVLLGLVVPIPVYLTFVFFRTDPIPFLATYVAAIGSLGTAPLGVWLFERRTGVRIWLSARPGGIIPWMTYHFVPTRPLGPQRTIAAT